MWPFLDLMPVPPRWQLSSPAGRTVPPHSRMARRQPGQESTGQERQPRRQPRKAALLRSCPVSSALLPKTQRRSIRTDRSRIETYQRPGKTRNRLGRRRAKGPPRQQNRFAAGINLWQIGFEWIRRLCRISQNTFTCNMFSWSRLGDLNPGPTHYERHSRAASLIEVTPLQAISLTVLQVFPRTTGLLAGY